MVIPSGFIKHGRLENHELNGGFNRNSPVNDPFSSTPWLMTPEGKMDFSFQIIQLLMRVPSMFADLTIHSTTVLLVKMHLGSFGPSGND